MRILYSGLLALLAAFVFSPPVRADQGYAAPSSAPAISREYTVRAHAGDLVTVTLIQPAAQTKNVTDESDGARVLADVYDNVGKKLHTLSSRRRVGFVAPASGTYRIQASITGTHNGSPTLKLNPPMAPAIRMRGANVQPLETYRSERISRLAQDVDARVTGAVDQFWQEVLKVGGVTTCARSRSYMHENAVDRIVANGPGRATQPRSRRSTTSSPSGSTALCSCAVRSSTDAEDLLQRIFLKVIEAIAALRRRVACRSRRGSFGSPATTVIDHERTSPRACHSLDDALERPDERDGPPELAETAFER